MAYNPVNPNGQTSSSASAPVVIASDQSPVAVDVHDGSGNAINSSSNALNVYVTNSASGGTSVADEASFTAGTTALTPSGGVYNDSLSALSSGELGTSRVTSNRAVHTNIRNSSGTELATSSNPLLVSLANTGSNLTNISVADSATETNTSNTATNTTNIPNVIGTAGSAIPSKGIVVQGSDGTNARAVKTDSSGNVNVVGAGTAGSPSGGVVSIQGVSSGTSVPISGTVTANAGTNLNTSALATSTNITGGGQKTQIVDGSGNVISSTSNALNVAVTSGGGGGTQYTELATTTSATGTLHLGRYSSSLPTLTNGQMNEPMLDSSSRLLTTETNSSAINSNTSSTATNTTNIATNTSNLTNALGTAGNAIPSKGFIVQGSDGTDARALKTDSSGNLDVNVQGTVPVSGTFWQSTQPVSLATNTPTLQSGSTTAVTQATASNLNATVVGAGTAGSPSGGVISIQGVSSGTAISTTDSNMANTTAALNGTLPADASLDAAQVRTSEQSTLTNGKLTAYIADKVGKQIVLPYANPENFASNVTTAITSATNTSIWAAAGSGIKIYVTSLSIVNTGANNSLITITSGSGGTVLWYTIAPATGGSNITFPTPISTAANTALYVTTGTASSSIYVSAAGYTGA